MAWPRQGSRVGPRLVQLGVLLGLAFGLVYGVLAGVLFEFFVGGVDEVDAEMVGEVQQVDRDIAHFLFDRGPFLGREVAALLFGQPLEALEQLAHLAGQRHGEVLRAVVLLPVALLIEAPDLLYQLSHLTCPCIACPARGFGSGKHGRDWGMVPGGLGTYKRRRRSRMNLWYDSCL